MAWSIARLTLYATIDAMESDLRAAVNGAFDSRQNPSTVFHEGLLKRVTERYQEETGLDASQAGFSDLVEFMDFGDAFSTINRNQSQFQDDLADHVRQNTAILESLVGPRNRVMHGRPLEVDDFAKVMDAAAALVDSRPALWTNTGSILDRLKREPSFVTAIPIQVRNSPSAVRHNLPTPDFDETGFVGRRKEMAQLDKALKGPHPVVNILGPGGQGKTALALNSLYALLEAEKCPFEAIVWSTAKSTQLTATHITKIANSITDSMAVVKAVGRELSAEQAPSTVEGLVALLEGRKILVVIDNLETVLDDRLRGLVGNLPPGNKLLLTSRVGLGAFDYPIKLGGLEDKEAVFLLRALARIRNSKPLQKLTGPQLLALCNKLDNNPGFVKWLVAAVATGRRPEDVVANPNLFLDFCLSNVYRFQSAAARKVATFMYCVPKPVSPIEISTLTRLGPEEVQQALQELVLSNMVDMVDFSLRNHSITGYALNDLVRKYLGAHHPPSSEEAKTYTTRWISLQKQNEELAITARTRPYALTTVGIRHERDMPTALLLHAALSCAHRGDFAQADTHLETARRLDPSYFEVPRVEAVVQWKKGNAIGAREQYLAAIELAPEHAPLHLFYGGFLLRTLHDPDAALEQIELAKKLDPEAIDPQIELCRVFHHLRRFPEAVDAVEKLLASNPPEFHKIRIWDLGIRALKDWLETQTSFRETDGAIKTLKRLLAFVATIPPHSIDAKMTDKLRFAHRAADRLRGYVRDETTRTEVEQLEAELESLLARYGPATAVTSAPGVSLDPSLPEFIGAIVTYDRARGYGFVESDDGYTGKLFFHATTVFPPDAIRELRKGLAVSFRVGRNEKGVCALEVRPQANR